MISEVKSVGCWDLVFVSNPIIYGRDVDTLLLLLLRKDVLAG